LLIDLDIDLDAPLRDDFERFPRLAASAIPAAFCWFFDFAGIHKYFACSGSFGFVGDVATAAVVFAMLTETRGLSLTRRFSEVILTPLGPAR